ncbi:hypothetical protein JQW64_19600 [Sulfitobacter pseudonitzschiae]|nr:hypothetical protein [Pseudosulfitobacter pseudonitzschiae]
MIKLSQHHKNLQNITRLKGLGFSRENIAYAARTYYRFTMITADVESLLTKRDVVANREAIWL